MLIPGFQNEALSTVIASSNRSRDYLDAYEELRQCAKCMLDKYEQQQKTPKNRCKLRIKSRAVAILLEELSKIPKDGGVTRDALSSALERHIEALQGQEHLLSERGNTYQLIKQTQGLRKRPAWSSLDKFKKYEV